MVCAVAGAATIASNAGTDACARRRVKMDMEIPENRMSKAPENSRSGDDSDEAGRGPGRPGGEMRRDFRGIMAVGPGGEAVEGGQDQVRRAGRGGEMRRGRKGAFLMLGFAIRRT